MASKARGQILSQNSNLTFKLRSVEQKCKDQSWLEKGASLWDQQLHHWERNCSELYCRRVQSRKCLAICCVYNNDSEAHKGPFSFNTAVGEDPRTTCCQNTAELTAAYSMHSCAFSLTVHVAATYCAAAATLTTTNNNWCSSIKKHIYIYIYISWTACWLTRAWKICMLKLKQAVGSIVVFLCITSRSCSSIIYRNILLHATHKTGIVLVFISCICFSMTAKM